MTPLLLPFQHDLHRLDHAEKSAHGTRRLSTPDYTLDNRSGLLKLSLGDKVLCLTMVYLLDGLLRELELSSQARARPTDGQRTSQKARAGGRGREIAGGAPTWSALSIRCVMDMSSSAE